MLLLLRVYCKYFVWNKYLKFKNKYSSTRSISNVAFNKNYRTLETGKLDIIHDLYQFSRSLRANHPLWQIQDRQCTYNVTMRRVCETLLQWKSKKYYIFLCVCVCGWVGGCRCSYKDACVCLCACSLTYPACNAHMPCFLRPLWLHHIFATSSHKRHDSRKKVTENKMCFLNFFYNFHFKHFSF